MALELLTSAPITQLVDVESLGNLERDRSGVNGPRGPACGRYVIREPSEGRL